MAIVVPNASEVLILQLLLQVSGNVLKLFSNNVTVGPATVAADLTVVTGGGYSSVTLTSGNWGFTAAATSIALYNQFVNFSFTGTTGGSGLVYGYFVVNAGGALLYGENLPSPVTPVSAYVLPIRPRVTLKNAS